MAVPQGAPPGVVGLQFGGRGQKLGHFRFDRLGQKGARPIAQDFSQPISQSPWLNQFENVIVRHGISLLRSRSGGSNTPTICRLPRFTPSPTFSHSSPARARSRLQSDLPSLEPNWRFRFWSLRGRYHVRRTGEGEPL